MYRVLLKTSCNVDMEYYVFYFLKIGKKVVSRIFFPLQVFVPFFRVWFEMRYDEILWAMWVG